MGKYLDLEAKKRLDNLRKNWDRRSHEYVEYASTHLIKNKEDENNVSDVVQSILNTFSLNENDIAVDIGCGPGQYDILLSKYVGKVVGTDISPNMIKYAQQLSREYDAENTEFRVMTLQEGDFEKEGYINKFDLAYATFTPAIINLDDFKIFASLTHKYGFLRGFIYRHNSLRDYISEHILEKPDFWNNNNSAKEYFDYLWEQGFNPSINLKKEVYERTYNSVDDCLENLISFYGDSLKPENINALKSYLELIKSPDGTITSQGENMIYTLTWSVDPKYM